MPSDGVVGEWFAVPHGSRSIGAVFADATAAKALMPLDVRQAFDVLLFVARTTRARPNVRRTAAKPLPSRAPRPSNLDFSSGPVGVEPPGWQLSERAREAGHRALVEDGAPQGQRCLIVEARAAEPTHFANVLQRIDATPFRGGRLRLQAIVRTEGACHAQLWVRIDRHTGEQGFFDNMGLRPVRSAAWQEHVIEGKIDEDAAVLSFGMVVVGEGKAWFSGVQLELLERGEG